MPLACVGCGSVPEWINLATSICVVSFLIKHTFLSFSFLLLSSIHLFVVFSLCWHNTGWGRLVLLLLQIGHKSSNTELWTSLRGDWQPAGPSNIQEDRAVLNSSKSCLFCTPFDINNLCSRGCRNNTVLGALRRMIHSVVVWTSAVKKPVAFLF